MKKKVEENSGSQELVQTPQRWVASASRLQAERFEVAGALFGVREKIGEAEVRSRLSQFRGGEEK